MSENENLEEGVPEPENGDLERELEERSDSEPPPKTDEERVLEGYEKEMGRPVATKSFEQTLAELKEEGAKAIMAVKTHWDSRSEKFVFGRDGHHLESRPELDQGEWWSLMYFGGESFEIRPVISSLTVGQYLASSKPSLSDQPFIFDNSEAGARAGLRELKKLLSAPPSHVDDEKSKDALSDLLDCEKWLGKCQPYRAVMDAFLAGRKYGKAETIQAQHIAARNIEMEIARKLKSPRKSEDRWVTELRRVLPQKPDCTAREILAGLVEAGLLEQKSDGKKLRSLPVKKGDKWISFATFQNKISRIRKELGISV